MALSKSRLKLKIKTALDSESDTVVDPAQARDRMADAIAQAIIDEIKSARVNYVSGLTSATGGPVTGTMSHTIS